MTTRLVGRALLLAAVLAALVSGCGSATAEDKNAKESLVGLEDLPSGAKVAEPFPEPCTPIPILEDGKTEVAVTKPLEFESIVLREALGIFPTEEAATSAYEDLTSPERVECVGRAIEELGSGEGIEVQPPTSFEVAEQDSGQKYRSTGADGSTSGAVDVVSLRSGVCVATLIFISEEEEEEGIQTVTEAVADHLPDSC
jgi:hypothetical protein